MGERENNKVNVNGNIWELGVKSITGILCTIFASFLSV